MISPVAVQYIFTIWSVLVKLTRDAVKSTDNHYKPKTYRDSKRV